MHSGVDHCLCGVHADSNLNAVATYTVHRCESKWVCLNSSHISLTKIAKCTLVTFRMHITRKSAKPVHLPIKVGEENFHHNDSDIIINRFITIY